MYKWTRLTVVSSLGWTLSMGIVLFSDLGPLIAKRQLRKYDDTYPNDLPGACMAGFLDAISEI